MPMLVVNVYRFAIFKFIKRFLNEIKQNRLDRNACPHSGPLFDHVVQAGILALSLFQARESLVEPF